MSSTARALAPRHLTPVPSVRDSSAPAASLADRIHERMTESRRLGDEVVSNYVETLRKLAADSLEIAGLQGAVPDGVREIARRQAAQATAIAASIEVLCTRGRS